MVCLVHLIMIQIHLIIMTILHILFLFLIINHNNMDLIFMIHY